MRYFGILLYFISVAPIFAGIGEKDVIVMPIHNTSKFYVSFSEHVEPQDVIIKIKKENGALIYTDIAITDKITKVYDMREYGVGTFEVYLKGMNFNIKKTVIVGEKPGFDVQVIRKQKRLELIYLSQCDELDIYVEDEKGNILYQDKSKLKQYQRVFDMSNLPLGRYSFKLTNGEKVFEEFFDIKN